MKTITEYRKESTLDRLIRIEGKVITRKEWLNSMHNNGYTVRSEEVPAVKYNRIKFNRMDWSEQRKYEKRLAEKKTEYRIYCETDTFYTITKTEFDYFNSLN